jgi:hypothetical protein
MYIIWFEWGFGRRRKKLKIIFKWIIDKFFWPGCELAQGHFQRMIST